jgi:arginyl-tRNA synthetase
MNPFDEILAAVGTALDRLVDTGRLPAGLDRQRVGVEPPREAGFGDAATNAALLLAKPAGLKPMALAEALAAELCSIPLIVEATPAPPGFVNLRLAPGFWREQIREVLDAGGAYGRCELGRGRKINIEYCSANPTGDLHVGHGRGTVIGDALANLLEQAGYEVTREYYINDGGAQIEALARSIHHRYREALGEAPGPLAEGLYPLPELVPVAEAIAARDGRRWLELPEEAWIELFGSEAVAAMMERIRADLAALGVQHDVFVSERELLEAGKIDEAVAHLEALGLLYTGTLPPPKGKIVEDWEPVPQLLFRASQFGDEMDRPLKRANGAWTYFAADVAYHLDKHRRGFEQMIDVWGADHGGYVKRMQAAVRAVSEGRAELVVKLCQLVNLLEGGQPLKMSKRSGRIVTLRDVVEDVGAGVFRFIMLTRKNDASLDFDLVKVKEQSKDNPVFYVQYAHARICSVFRNAGEAGLGDLTSDLARADLDRLEDSAELGLIKLIAQYPRVLLAAAEHREPHRIAFYLYDLASEFHALWTLGRERSDLRFLIPEEPALTRARLAMIEAVRSVIASGLGIIGVEPLSEMH